MLLWTTYIIIAITILGVAVGRLPYLHMNRATIALAGSASLILIGSISLEQAFASVDLNTILLLFSMMIINANLCIAGFFNIVIHFVVKRAKTPFMLLALIVCSSGILSALFLNDTIAIMLTPMVLDVVIKLKRNPIPYLIGLAASANIGSAATIVGNPQNMIIGVSSGISFLNFFTSLFPLAFAGLFILLFLVRIIYKKEFINSFEPLLEFDKFEVRKPLLIKSSIALVFLLAAFMLNYHVATSSFVVASMLLITRRIKPERVFQEIDWQLLVFFSALFIVTSVLGHIILTNYQFSNGNIQAGFSVSKFTAISVVLSNLISNVPAVLVLSPIVKSFVNREKFWLLLAVTSTFAGNLTLIGSVANLIVAESAKRRGVIIGFIEYLKIGLPVTLITIIFCILWFLFLY